MTGLAVRLPLKIRLVAESFAIEDAAGRAVAYVYWCNEEQRRGVIGRFTKAEAKAIAQEVARALTEAERGRALLARPPDA